MSAEVGIALCAAGFSEDPHLAAQQALRNHGRSRHDFSYAFSISFGCT
jgi:hypothetical protein